MGTAVAAASVAARLRVVLADADAGALDRAGRTVKQQTANLTDLPAEDVEIMLAEQLVTTGRFDELAACGLVIESITENIDAKTALYVQLEPLLSDGAVLATNTSTIPIDHLASGLRRPERFCGLHFFHPVAERPLVEIVRGSRTAEAAVVAVRQFAKNIDKQVLVVNDGPGFVVNRLLMPYLTEAVELLLDGVPVERVEQVATDFGMAKGPLRMIDEIGLDTVVAGGRVLWRAFPERIVLSPLMVAMYKAGRFGRKTGAGFFNYTSADAQKTPPVDLIALEKIREWARKPRGIGDEQIRDRLFLTMVVEAARLLEEGKSDSPSDIDRGVVLGLGFPAERGGLLQWADLIGPAAIAGRLGRLADLGPRAEPPELLRRMAATGRPFRHAGHSTT
jgi:3-hydroxyacyl-CoA dehydrogenase/enoyl-CoA hydratase/3-hydroxybutyryl-CoA epimerase/3-hydroxyacyl-CoA dehydrogenase/enoyl-CoA hydratase/3-hydroxybutyryl-CoA epimerase/enoyl-CoA isomerase